MGMRRTDFIILGVELDFDEISYEDYEAEINLEDGRAFDMLYDGVCGEFCLAGKVLSSTDDIDGFSMMNISQAAAENRVEVHEVLRNEFGDHCVPRIYVVTMWS